MLMCDIGRGHDIAERLLNLASGVWRVVSAISNSNRQFPVACSEKQGYWSKRSFSPAIPDAPTSAWYSFRMKPMVTIGTASMPDGAELKLVKHAGEYLLKLDGAMLMSTQLFHSEQELARLACVALPAGAHVLIGGLGLGFTLRAALDLLPADGRAVLVELMPEVVEWNRGSLGDRTGQPLDDPRVELVQGDVAQVIRRRTNEFAAVMLDIDDGPCPTPLYSRKGLEALWQTMIPRGCAAIWSAEDVPAFPRKLRRNGFHASSHQVAARKGRGGRRHTIFVARKPL